MNNEIVYDNKTSIVLRGKGWSWECHICFRVRVFSRLRIGGQLFRRGIELIIWEFSGKIKCSCYCSPERGERCRECWMPDPKLHGLTEHSDDGSFYSSYFCDDVCHEKWVSNYSSFCVYGNEFEVETAAKFEILANLV